MKIIQGDLVQLARDKQFDLIIHGCNCFCTMNAGIARQIKDTFPQAFEADTVTRPGDRSKLGTYTSAVIQLADHRLVVVNGYTQFDYAGPGVLVDYDAIETLFTKVRTHFAGLRMGYPKIGAGLAGGDWDRISQSIDRALDGEDHTLVEFIRS
jgi:O-acetyl-ADP-ribose deacetylase (regulator of RNase III)